MNAKIAVAENADILIQGKEKTRREMLSRRDMLNPDDISDMSRIIGEKIRDSDEYRNASTVFTYIECKSEVQTLALISKMFEDGKNVAVPITLSKKEGMYFSRILPKDLDHMTTARFGLTEPERKEPVEPDEKTLFLIPGSAYDISKNRLGYGAGYYDRYLEKRKYMSLIGICFDFQVVDEIIPEKTDIPMNHVVTEKRWI